MARGGRRPGAGAKKGGTRSRKPRAEIAERRRLVQQLSLVYRRPAEILAAIQREQPQVLEGLRSPYEVILQDLARIQDEYAEAVGCQYPIRLVAGQAATHSYSWCSPPSTGRAVIRPAAGGEAREGGPVGVSRPSER